MINALLVIVVLVSLTSFPVCKAAVPIKNAWNSDELYALGVKAYEAEDWNKTIEYLQKCISWHKRLYDQRHQCYESCHNLEKKTPTTEDQEEQFFHLSNQMAKCIHECNSQLADSGAVPLSQHSELSSAVHSSLKNGHIHNYIQMSLFQENDVNLAARHAATNYYLNPLDGTARSNIEYYYNREDTCNTDDECMPLETMLYRDLYMEGTELYSEKKFKEMVDILEQSLKYFYVELEKCRRECELFVRISSNTAFTDSVSSLYLSVMECKQNCPSTLGNFRDDDESDFFGSYFNYLQFGYYQTDRLHDAVKTVTTHRRIEPQNELAKMNSAYYQRLPGVSKKDFVEREDAKPVLDKLMEEKKFLEILQQTLNKKLEKTTPKLMDDAEMLEEDFEAFTVNRAVGLDVNYTVAESPLDHDGRERIVVDDLLTQEQCDDLLKLTEACIEGDGYEIKSPHTPKERFEGLSIMHAAKAATEKEANVTQVKLYMEASRRVRKAVQNLFNLTQYLHFSYTHLVCRTAKDGAQDGRDDLSHPVHADNCLLDTERKDCFKVAPAYTWRDYSAILYLNDDFEGGNFFFAHSVEDLAPQHSVKPKCGRMVGFSAGKENLHGVKAVTKGRRCAVALWFTLDPKYTELKIYQAAEALLNRKTDI